MCDISLEHQPVAARQEKSRPAQHYWQSKQVQGPGPLNFNLAIRRPDSMGFVSRRVQDDASSSRYLSLEQGEG